jgi:hypothetical protein
MDAYTHVWMHAEHACGVQRRVAAETCMIQSICQGLRMHVRAHQDMYYSFK